MSYDLKLSVSKVKTFLSCHKKYHFSYILKMPKKEAEYHVFGKFCHTCLENFHNAYIEGSTESAHVLMTRVFKDAVKEYQPQLTDEMKGECKKIISQYLKLFSSDKKSGIASNVIAVEKNFDFFVCDKIMLTGMIDRVQIDPDDVLHVCDYKTTKNKKYLKEDWFQLLTYAYYMLTHECTDAKTIRCSYILLRHDFEYITKEFSKDEILEVKDKYEKYSSDILKEKMYEPTPQVLCDWCDFIEICDEGQAFSAKQKAKKSLEEERLKVFGEVEY